MRADAVYILAILCLCVVASEWLVRRTALRHLGTALLVIVVTAVLANTGVLPAGSSESAPVPVYDAIFAYLAPLAIFWLLLPISLRNILRAGVPLIVLFLVGSAGAVIGAVVGMHLFGEIRALVPQFRAVGGMFVATYTGGGINFNAVALSEGVVRDGGLYAGAVAVDNVITALWMAATLALPRLLWPVWGGMRRPVGRGSAAPADEHNDTETTSPADLGLVLALGFAGLLAADRITAALGRLGWTVPSIAVLTAIALVLAQIPAVSRLRGTRLAGMLAVYLFLAVVGAFCDFSQLAALGHRGLLLLGFASTLVLVHGVITFAAARLGGLDPDMASIASQANVGGSTSALALARSLGRDDLVLPGVLIGALGNAIGTFIGLSVMRVL